MTHMNHNDIPARAHRVQTSRTTDAYPTTTGGDFTFTQAPRRQPTCPTPQAAVDVWEEEDEAPIRRPGRSYLRVEQRMLPVVQARKQSRHPLLYLGLGMVSAAVLASAWLIGSAWWQQQSDTWTYGYPRMYQTDQVVGQNESPGHPSHFLAINLHGQIIVVEFPGGDPTHARDFLVTTLFGPGADREPVTLRFRDVNHDGKPDLLVQVDGQVFVYLNSQGTFRPLPPGEQVGPLA